MENSYFKQNWPLIPFHCIACVCKNENKNWLDIVPWRFCTCHENEDVRGRNSSQYYISADLEQR